MYLMKNVKEEKVGDWGPICWTEMLQFVSLHQFHTVADNSDDSYIDLLKW